MGTTDVARPLSKGIAGATREGEYAKQLPWLKESCLKYEDLGAVDKITAGGGAEDNDSPTSSQLNVSRRCVNHL